MREFKKLKSKSDWDVLDDPVKVWIDPHLNLPDHDQRVLRMLVRPKYGEFKIPEELGWLRDRIHTLASFDRDLLGIKDSWCYVTVRKGLVNDDADEWHFDGGSLRRDIIPERNYTWCDRFGMQFKSGDLGFPEDFDPLTHNMFAYASEELADEPVQTGQVGVWNLLSPFCLHRRDPESSGEYRTFIRISFIDIEVRDVNNTQNPLFPVESYDRDPARTFRDRLTNYHTES